MQLDAIGVIAMKKVAGAIQQIQLAMLLKIGMGKIAHGVLRIIIVSKMDAGNIIIKLIALILLLQKD